MTLKEPYKNPPGGYSVYQPETKFTTSGMTLEANAAVLQRHRQANKALFDSLNIPTDYASCVAYVNDQICARLAQRYGDNSQWCCGGGTSSPFTQAPKSASAGVAGAAGRILSGIKIYAKWLGSGGKPVDATLAEQRANICRLCPHNHFRKTWLDRFTEPVAAELLKMVEMKNDLKLSTKYDDDLGVCVVCECPLKTKIWTPLKHILSELSEETRKGLIEYCWITKETP